MLKNTLRVVSAAAGVALFLLGCGAEGDPSSRQPVDEETQNAELSFDISKVAAVSIAVDAQGNRDLWVFACYSGRLHRNTAREANVPSWRGWEDFNVDCRGTPTAAADSSSAGPVSVVVYVRRNDDNLWEAWWPKNNQNPSWANVSQLSALGQISGSPTIVYGKKPGFSEVSVVARTASDNSLYTADYYSGSWHRNIVFSGVIPPGRGETGAIRSVNTVRGVADVVVDGYSSLPMYITGRGLSSTNDTTGWVAVRNNTARGSFTRDFSFGDFTPTGTPAMQKHYPASGGKSLMANFNGTLKYWSFNKRAWESTGCSVGGSPVPVQGTFGYARSNNGKLMQYMVFSPFCQERNFTMLSAPAVGGSHVFYTGPWGELFHYYAEAQQSMGITLP